MNRTVLTSGCFDMLHVGHIRFLQQAAEAGPLFVAVASDTTIEELKGHRPEVPEEERLESVLALRYVSDAAISPGRGILDFVPLLEEVRPAGLVVNRDGDYPQKRALCADRGISYTVIDQHSGPHTKQLRQRCRIPFRVDLAGGWLDQPFVSQVFPGDVVVAALQPLLDYHLRSGLATSTRETARRLWGCRLPVGEAVDLARWLFACENPPGTVEVSGSQDALGICLPGISRLSYAGGYWPDAIERCICPETALWLGQHLRLVPTPPRPPETSILSESHVTVEAARALAKAATDCWEAILTRDPYKLGQAVTAGVQAQLSMFPRMAVPELLSLLQVPGVYGAKICGAGGGGYLLAICAPSLDLGLRVSIQQPSES